MPSDSEINDGKAEALLAKRYRQLLGYIAELDRLRTSTVQTVEGHPDRIDLGRLPDHPSIEWNHQNATAFLAVKRPETPPSPPCPEGLTEWVTYKPNQVRIEPSHHKIIRDGSLELDWETDGPIGEWDQWIADWRTWASSAGPAYEARDLYIKLYDIKASLDRNSEQVELVAADVCVAFRTVNHPVLINPVRIDIDVERSVITVGCTDDPAQIYGDAIRTVVSAAGDSIAKARIEVSENPEIWAFAGEDVDRFARRFVQGVDPNGQFQQAYQSEDNVRAYRSPWLLLRRRATGLAELAEGLLSKFEEDGEVPAPIQPVLLDREQKVSEESEFRGEPDEDELSFFTKPANAEQLAILRIYRRSGNVHVQGPPGTGKTHTIANLIGHFLAEGKSVLVTSEKPQALAVLREKVVERLQPLCVSLVGADAGAGLKAGMRGLYEELATTEHVNLEREITQLTEARKRLIEQLQVARRMLRKVIELEHLPVEARAWRGSPEAAGKYVHSRRGRDSWIPGKVIAGSEPPLSQAEFEELLDLVGQLSNGTLEDARKPLPSAEDVLSPADFGLLLTKVRAILSDEPPKPAIQIPELMSLPGGIAEADQLLRDIREAVETFASLNVQYRELANRLVETPTLEGLWSSWIARAGGILEEEQECLRICAPYDFSIRAPRQQVIDAAKQLLEHVRRTGRAMPKGRLFNKQDKLLFESVSAASQLGDEASLQALVLWLEFEEKRDRFRAEMRAAGGSFKLETLLSDDVERNLVRDTSIEIALRWVATLYQPIMVQLAKTEIGIMRTGFNVAQALPNSGQATRMAWWLEQVLRPAILRYKHRSERAAIDSELHALMDLARRWQTPASSQPIRDLAAAVIGRDLDAYVNAHAQVEELRDRVEPVQRRDALLEKLRGRAPEFAISVGPGEFQRLESHGSLDDAWSYALIAQELSDRHSLSLDEIKNDLDRFKRELDSITIQLASCQAWAAQHRRVTQPVVSALSRFHEAQRKIGGGKGARVPELQRTMRNAMRDAKDAFPVWIMPLHDLTRSFDFTKTKFDVVIVDESSQLSAVGLITLLIADSAIVVGDDEQTEPSLAGVPMESVQAVIREHLVDFNDGVLWSPDSSLYSFAGRFGTTVGLREHFRCVPQIISFSSKLCYQSRIQALRDPSEVLQLPHVVPVLCPPIELNATGDVTETEALEIACLVVACSEQEEYKNQSFGVIALRGSAGSRGDDPQTARITELIRDTLGPTKWEQFAARSKFKTGVPPAFQGDERDVVLISLGDDPNRGTGDGSGPLRLISDTTLPGISYKKRMNVAVSRARNQVFIAHSLNHFEAHLKENDIRRRLLEFAYAPDEWLEATNTHNPQAESPFEQAVYADLVGRGYHVTPQVAAGHYRIDLVAKGSAGQVAIECDGDAYHQDAAADLARQLVLERCGWRFIRVRGSEYYKDPEAAINRIVGELNGFGVSQCSASIDPSEVSGELLTRVRSRAQEIREIILGGKQLAERVEPKRMSEQSLEEVALAAVHSEAVSITPEAGSAHDSELLFEIQPRQGDSVFGTPDVVDEPQARPNVPQPMEPYVEFTEVGFPDPKECSDEAVCRDLVRIVEVEGPATAARILDKYRIAVGYGRLRGSTRERIEHALETCQRKGILLAAHDYDCADQMVYRFPGTLDVRLRKRGPRDWEDVPMGEIVAVMKVTADTYWHLSQEALFRQVLAAFDLKKLTSGTAERLSIAYGLYKRQTLDSPDSNAGPSGL